MSDEGIGFAASASQEHPGQRAGGQREAAPLLIRVLARGQVYLIEAPERSAVVRRSHVPDGGGGWKVDILFIPTEDGGIARVSAEPPDLLIELAREGTYGLRLIDPEAAAGEGLP